MNRDIKFLPGSKVKVGEEDDRFVAMCPCGKNVIVSDEEEKLKYFLKEDYKAPCCDQMYENKGKMVFKGEQIKIDIKSESDINRLVIPGNKGVTNKQMIPAIKENIENEDNLRLLYAQYPKAFKGSTKYISKKMKPIAQKIILEKEPDFVLE